MSWKKYSRGIKWYDIWRGLWTAVGDVPVDLDLRNGAYHKSPGSIYLAQATNVHSPGVSAVLEKIPGFETVRSTAINAAGIFTGGVHLGEIADETILSVSIAAGSHNFYRDNANPPGAISGGTNPTIGQDNHVNFSIFHDGTDPVAIACTLLRDTPQSFTGAVSRANFSISGTTIPQFTEVFGQRLLMFAPSVGGTVFDDRVYWSDIRDGNLITDTTTQFESFETTLKDRIRAGKKISDICMVGKLHNVFTMVVTPEATKPFAIQEEPAGRFKGPVSNHIIEADQKLWWMSQNNIHSLDQTFRIRDWADQIKPTIIALLDTRREFTISGYWADADIIVFGVTSSGDTSHKTSILLNIKTGALYIRTIQRNMFFTRLASDKARLQGGGLIGLFYNEFTGTAGNLDDATAVIDGDVIGPRIITGLYGHKAKVPFVFVAVDPIGTESITIQVRYDDETTWRDPTGSPYTVSGTDNKIIAVPIRAWCERVQIRIRNNSSGQLYRVKAIGVPVAVASPLVAA